MSSTNVPYPEPSQRPSYPPPESDLSKKPKSWNLPTVIVIVILIIFAVISIAFFTIITVLRGPAEIVSVTHSPEHPLPGEQIIITVETKNASECGFQYGSFFKGGGASGSQGGTNFFLEPCEFNIGPFVDGTEVWYVAYVAVRHGPIVFSENYTIQIGNIERSQITSLNVSNISFIPQNPTPNTNRIEVSVNVTSNASISSVQMEYMLFYPGSGSVGGGGGGGGTMTLVSGNTYECNIYLGPSEEYPLPKGSLIMFRIGAQDDSGNTALSPVISITIS